MGKLAITGKAEREVAYDAVELSISFCVYADTSSEALDKIMTQCEDLLEAIAAFGVDPKEIRVDENSLDKRYNDGDAYYIATRELKIIMPFNMPFVNALTEMIQKKNYDVEYSCDYHLTNKTALHEDLLKEALSDSKKKAEFIAEIMGQKIIGIDSVEHDSRRESDWLCCEKTYVVAAAGSRPRSDLLESPLTTETESIDVVWLIE